MRNYKDFNPCTFCSVKMFGTGTYTGDNGETVYFDYVQPKDLEEFCNEHCSFKKKQIEFTIATNGIFEKEVEKEMLKILKK